MLCRCVRMSVYGCYILSFSTNVADISKKITLVNAPLETAVDFSSLYSGGIPHPTNCPLVAELYEVVGFVETLVQDASFPLKIDDDNSKLEIDVNNKVAKKYLKLKFTHQGVTATTSVFSAEVVCPILTWT